MRLETLELTTYGPFESQTVSFRPGLTLLFGHNEAGKSSLLKGIRAAFFGAGATRVGDKTVRTLDGWEGVRKSTRLNATTLLDDGRSLEFERTNSNKTPVTGSISEMPINAVALAELIGIDNVQYRNVFGFTLEELRQGEQSLLDASVIEVLFGGGMGRLAQFRQLQKQVEKQSGELFRARGKNQLVNVSLLAVHEDERRLREQLHTPQQFLEETAEIETLQQSAQQTEAELNRLREELQRLDQLSKAETLVARLREHEASQAALELEQPLREAEVAHAREIIASFVRTQEQLEQVTVELEDSLSEQASLQLRGELVPLAATIESLHSDASRFRQVQRELPGLKEQLDELIAKTASEEVSLQLPPEALDRIADWNKRLENLSKGKLKREAELASLKRQLGEIEVVLSDSGNRAYETAVLACDRSWQTCDREQGRFEELQRLVDRDADQMAALQTRLLKQAGWSTWPKSLGEMPSAERVRQELEQLDQYRSDVSSAKARLKELERDIAERRDQIAVLQADPTTVSVTQVREARKRRDKFLAELIETATGEETSVTGKQLSQLQTLSQDADDLSDRMTANAQATAREATLELELSHLDRDSQAAEVDRQRAEATVEQWFIDWQSVWAWHGVTEAIDPTDAENWLENLETWKQLAVKHQEHSAELEVHKQRRADAAEETAKILPDDLKDARVDAVRAWLESEAISVRDRQTDRRRAEQQRPTLIQQREAAETDLEQLRAGESVVEAEFQQWKQSNQLPEQLSIAGIDRAVDLQEHHQRLLDQRDSLQRQVNAAERTRTTFLNEAIALTPGPLEAADAVTLVSTLYEQLQQHRQAAAANEAIAKRIRQLTEQQTRLQTKVSELQGQLDGFQATLPGEQALSLTEFRLLVERSGVFWETESHLRLLRGKLEMLAPGQRQEELVEELAKFTAIERDDRRVSVQKEFDETRSQQTAVLERLAIVREKRRQLAQTDRLAELQTQLESDRAELRDAVESYAPIVVLQAMLDRAIAKFSRSVRPELLESVAKLFGQLTDGEYVDVDRCLEADSLRVLRQDQQWRSPAELSTGTRELLYLAVRLAFVRDHVQSHESMPLFLDDVLVNIDTRRTRAIIRTLLDLSDQMQIVVLSCRPELAMLFEQLELGDAIQEIQAGQLDESRQMLTGGQSSTDQITGGKSESMAANSKQRPKAKTPKTAEAAVDSAPLFDS